MSDPCAITEPAFQAFHQDVYRLCFVLSRDPAAARELAFQAFLRLGAAKAPPEDLPGARALLLRASVRLCDDYFLKKPHRKPRRDRLEALELPFPISDALWRVLGLSFSRRATLCLACLGAAPAEIASYLRASSLPSAKGCVPAEDEEAAVASIILTQEEAAALNDRIYARFAERSVAVENALLGVRSAFDRAAPWLALAAIAIMAFAFWYVSRFS